MNNSASLGLNLFERIVYMNLDKSRKRISKRVKKGFQGYPVITIAYYGPDEELATKVSVGFIEEENADIQIENFNTESDVREDVAVQSALIKIIDRSGAKTVSLIDRIIACPHEEGVDFPKDEDCPECEFWHGKARVTGEYSQS